jgi:hypothetical protein
MVNGLGRGRLSGRPFHEAHQDSAFPHGDLIGLTVWRALDSPLGEASPMSELILHKMASQLCRSEGKAWSLKDFENGMPGVAPRMASMTLVVISTYPSAIGAPNCPANETKLPAVPFPRLTTPNSPRRSGCRAIVCDALANRARSKRAEAV